MFPWDKKKLSAHRADSRYSRLFIVPVFAVVILTAQVGRIEGQHNTGRNHHNLFLLSRDLARRNCRCVVSYRYGSEAPGATVRVQNPAAMLDKVFQVIHNRTGFSHAKTSSAGGRKTNLSRYVFRRRKLRFAFAGRNHG